MADKIIKSSTVEKETPGGSKIITFQLTSDAQRGLTVAAPRNDSASETTSSDSTTAPPTNE